MLSRAPRILVKHPKQVSFNEKVVQPLFDQKYHLIFQDKFFLYIDSLTIVLRALVSKTIS